MSSQTLSRRLPGISFETKVPPPADLPPRMDIAVFVGFASSGPLHVPVPIEDAGKLKEIFGDDLPLAWDSEKGERVYAHLAPAVRSFFRNGGRRCWVIRVEYPKFVNGHLEFDKCFLDPDLHDVGIAHLMTAADFLRYQSPSPRSLKGIHAALEIEEATIIAVPDAMHRGWEPVKQDKLLNPEDSCPTFRPEWWHHLDCTLKVEEIKKQPEVLSARKPLVSNFLDCGIKVIPPPVLSCEEPDQGGTFKLSWTVRPNERYVLEESKTPDWDGAREIYSGNGNCLEIFGYPEGDYYFRVRANADNFSTDWSDGVPVRISPQAGWKSKKPGPYSSDTLNGGLPKTLFAVHHALLRMCAARGDLFAVLALPDHYGEDDSIKYIEDLKSRSSTGAGIGGVESFIFSYGAVYYPWLTGMEQDSSGFRSIPPDGAICGVIAKRALARGAWIAPANELMTGITALTPDISEKWRPRLQQAQINILRQEPYGFVTLSADTLSDDHDLRPVNVRRFLILLRRLALRLGARYVFESNDDAFRRMVQRGFEAMLDDMFVRGAFAGKTPGAAYQVVTGNSLNTPQSIEQGRFIVELKVAPSLPMTFITVRLLQTGDRLSFSEGR